MEKKSASALVCPECGGEFSASDLLDGDSIVTCLNCNKHFSTAEILRKSSEVEAEEIRSNAYREAEYERTKAYREAEAEKRKVEYERIRLDYQKMKNQNNKELIQDIKKTLEAIIPIVVLISLFVAGWQLIFKDERDYTTTFEWPERGLFLLLPQPETNNGTIVNESEKVIEFELYNSSPETFESYTKLCRDLGYTEDYFKDNDSFSAKNADGYSLNISYDKSKKIIEVNLNTYYVPIEIGYSSWDLVGKQYSDVVTLLEEKGFTYIITKEDGWNLFKKSGEVKKVTIKGEEEFLDWDKFLSDAKIIIYYYK